MRSRDLHPQTRRALGNDRVTEADNVDKSSHLDLLINSLKKLKAQRG